MGKPKDNLSGLFQGTTAPYNASAPGYGAMPQQVNMQPFMPGQQQAIAQQLSQGYGQPAQQYTDAMNQYYAPVNMTRLSEPLTQSMRAWGLKPNGQPGGVEGTLAQNYQQYGMGTGSPWLDQMFGLKNNVPAAPDPSAPPATPAPTGNPYDPVTEAKRWRQWTSRNPAPIPTGGLL